MSDRNSPQVTLEQLLRIKRAERPEPEFWQQFERDLRTKQLAAIVEPRPWWAPFIRISSRVARYQLPVGATAILALTFLSVRDYRLPEAVDAQFSPSVVITKVDTMPGSAVAVISPDKPIGTIEQTANVDSLDVVASHTTSANQQSKSTDATPDQVSDMVSMLSGGAHVEEAYSPAARVIAANLEAVKASAPELVQMMDRVSGMDSLLAPRVKNQAVDPLARVQAPRESRRSNRLLASALTSASYSSGNMDQKVSSQRISRTLTEERMYDSISRFGVRADQFAIKF